MFDSVWHTMEAQYNPTTKLLSLIVDGGTPKTTTVSPFTSPPGAKTLYIGTNSSGSRGFTGAIDEVVVSNLVPEPTALVLLATGLIGLLAYAWRKRK